VDCNKCLICRVVQFTYLTGNKRQRQFSNNFVDFSKDSVNNIGIFVNWFSVVSQSLDERFEEKDFILFKSIEVEFTCGYITADCYMATIDKAVVMDAPKWSDRCSFDLWNIYYSFIWRMHWFTQGGSTWIWTWVDVNLDFDKRTHAYDRLFQEFRTFSWISGSFITMSMNFVD